MEHKQPTTIRMSAVIEINAVEYIQYLESKIRLYDMYIDELSDLTGCDPR